jgi:uroporphyrinogen-III decarboxylase
MSPDTYRRFYWKGLSALMTAYCDNGILPYVFCEGSYNLRLENLAEFEGGKAVFLFEKVDMKKAKSILGGKFCLCGNVPAALLAFGTPEQVTEEVKRTLDIMAPGGGFIMDASIELTSAQPRNVEAFFEATFKYGKY